MCHYIALPNMLHVFQINILTKTSTKIQHKQLLHLKGSCAHARLVHVLKASSTWQAEGDMAGRGGVSTTIPGSIVDLLQKQGTLHIKSPFCAALRAQQVSLAPVELPAASPVHALVAYFHACSSQLILLLFWVPACLHRLLQQDSHL